MKRYCNLYEKIYDLDNLKAAYKSARRGKLHYKDVKRIDKEPEKYLGAIKYLLKSQKYKTSDYHIFDKIEGGKLRTIYALPFYPDRIVHHAIMNICGEFWKRSLIRDTFQSLPGRGSSDLFRRVRKYVIENRPKYFLQIDVQKFYPSVPHSVVADIAISRFIKCAATESLLTEILHSTPGLPIGSFLSQIWGNLVLSPTDWYIKQELKVSGYFRYCDDLVFFGDSPEELRQILNKVTTKLSKLDLTIKPTWLIQNMHTHGLDFCGYVFKSCTVRLRKGTKVKFIDAATNQYHDSISSYNGCIKPLPDKNLWKYTNSSFRQKEHSYAHTISG